MRDLEFLVLRATRDEADQFHFERGAGDDADGYERDYRRIGTNNAKSAVNIMARLWEMGKNSETSVNPFGDIESIDEEGLVEMFEALHTHILD